MGFVYNTFTDLMFVWNARGGGRYTGFHVTGMIREFFFGLKFSIPDFLGHFFVLKLSRDFFGYSEQPEDSWLS